MIRILIIKDLVVRALQFSVLFLVAFQAVFTQTRPRLVEPPPANASPSPSGELEKKSAEQEGDVLRIDTTLVTVPVSVRDRNGRFIADLQSEDFHIYEDGIEQKVAYFAAVDTPFTVVLVLDTSASTWSKLSQIRDAAKVFVDQLRPDDQVMVVSFGMGVKVQCEATGDRGKIRKAIDSTSKGLSTHLYDAMQKVMKKYLDRIKGRKAVVLFTDGVDATSNDATYESNLRIAEEVDALIYSIRYDTYDPSIDTGAPSLPPPHLPWIFRKLPLPIPSIGGSSGGGAGSTRADYDRGERYLQQLAELTGGQVYEANRDLSYLRDAFSQIAAELGRQYSIGYYPMKKGASGERRQIKVRVSRPDVALRARGSYVFKDKSATGDKPSSNTEPEKKAPVLQKQP